MVNKQIRQSGRILDETAKISLHEQAINLHASAMHLVNNPDGPTLSAPYNHQSVLKKLPDMIRRSEMETISRMFPTLDSARTTYRQIGRAIRAGKADAPDVYLEPLLKQHILTQHRKRAALLEVDVEMQRLFPGGESGLKSELDQFRYSQAQALRSILTDKEYAFEGPWNHLADRLLSPNRESFTDILDLPFASKQQVTELANLIRDVNSGRLKLPDIRRGDIVALMLQGTAGATITQIAHRANFVKDVYSGNMQRLYQTMREPGEAWRTLADLSKSPMMEGSSDVDMGLIIRGGGNKLLSVFSKAKVQFPNGSIQELKGGAAIDAIVKHSSPSSFIGKTARVKGLEVPVEWYTYQNRELARIGSAQSALRTPIDRGGISVMPNGSSFQLVAHFSPFLDTYAQTGATSRVIGAGFAHSSILAASTSDILVSAFDLGPTLQSSLQKWQATGIDLDGLQVHLRVESLPGTQLGYAEIHRLQGDGLASEVSIVLDDDAAGHGWFIDSTPMGNEEFTIDDSGRWLAQNESAKGRFDALTVITHELGHLLGFTNSFEGFQSRIELDDRGRPFVEVGENPLWLDPTYSELDKRRHSELLMSSTLLPGIRKLPSTMEGEVLKVVRSIPVGGFTGWVVEGALNGGGIAFIPIQDALSQRPVSSTGIVNGDFNVSNPSDNGFGWSIVGQASVEDQRANIFETTTLVSDLAQSFVIPPGMSQLRFTLSGIQLSTNGNSMLPGDAIEVALLEVNDGQRLFSPMTGLSDSDAILNIQPDGTVFFAPQVSIEGVSNGSKLDLSQSIDVAIDLSNMEEGVAATLLFDLIGLGDDNSQFQVSDVELNRGIAESWHNSVLPFDVDNDKTVCPLDVLVLINEINRPTVIDSNALLPPITSTIGPPPFFDVNNDRYLTAIDILLVINHINRRIVEDPPPPVLPTSWHNLDSPGDVDDDGRVSPLDVLWLINELNQPQITTQQNRALPAITTSTKPAPYLDVDDDGFMTPLDVLVAINLINGASGEGEGESSPWEQAISSMDPESQAVADLIAGLRSDRS
jgi:hypothetical protein